jgi:ABC-type sugar transport system ATPase subunit
LSVGYAVRDISFSLRCGEIVGVIGLLGAGQNELARALFGLQPEVSGLVRRSGKSVLITSPKQAIGLGIGLLTDNRKLEGLIPEMSVRENVTLPSLAFFRRALVFISNRREVQLARTIIGRLRVKTPSINARINTLSGGNQQKAILARWLLRDLDILIFIAPTQGIDVGAKAEIYQYLSELAGQGKTILAVSEDALEILGISDRIFVMYQGRLTQVIAQADANEEMLLSAIQGNQAITEDARGKHLS